MLQPEDLHKNEALIRTKGPTTFQHKIKITHYISAQNKNNILAHCDPEESRPQDFQQEAMKPVGQHKHAITLNLLPFFPLFRIKQQFINQFTRSREPIILSNVKNFIILRVWWLDRMQWVFSKIEQCDLGLSTWRRVQRESNFLSCLRRS